MRLTPTIAGTAVSALALAGALVGLPTTATADDTGESTPTGGTTVDRTIQLTVPRRTEATTGRVSTSSMPTATA